ncbi:MAG: porphobilinogen synthase [Ignavibacteriae bacterium]|nr:porphobilinogen synthase [Ignavibacteriota bacterium]MCB9216477.1 porphobilinogen synthase [Ignavibacteria bacterium]
MNNKLDLIHRPRRLRRTEGIRNLVRETRLHTDNLVAPLFIVPGTNVRREVVSMPEVFQLSVDEVVRECIGLIELGIKSVILFGIPESKDAEGSSAWDSEGIIQRGIRAIRKEVPEMTIITDVCLCEYTDHGHCGLLDGEHILNDESVELYVRMAISHAEAGADMVAPSDMMDGRVAAIRDGLDAEGFEGIPIMSYAVKYASGFYGPFRDAADSTPSFGDRRSHQMDPANGREAMREALLDLEEGADILMVKPAMPNLDIINQLYQNTDVPIAAYQVSGEYAMLHAAAQKGWLDLERTMVESLTSIRRAGASIIITYFAARMGRQIQSVRIQK